MSDLNVLFEKIKEEATKEILTIPLEKIHSIGISKIHSDLLGSHTVVTYPPLDSLKPFTAEKFDTSDLKLDRSVNVYLHIPFCEYNCKFCPYITLANKGKDLDFMDTYLEALKKEIVMWAETMKKQNVEIASIYIGGGTPTSISTEHLEEILFFVTKTLPLSKDIEICVETSPRATIQPDIQEKLKLFEEYNISRMSIGIQSFDFESLQDMARTFPDHTEDDEEKAVQIIMDSKIENLNVDMIQDLPLKSKDYLQRLKEDLFKIAKLRPQHVTWYNMRLRPETTYSLYSGNTSLVTEEQSLHTRLIIWKFMEAIGYIILEGDRFALAEPYEDNFRKIRGSVDLDLIGIGVSAYSHSKQLFFQNSRTIGGNMISDSKKAIADYIKSMNERGHAVSFSFPYSKEEILAANMSLGLKKGLNFNKLKKEFEKESSCTSYFEKILDPTLRKLLDNELLVLGDDGYLGFSTTGRLFENEICALFYSPLAISNARQRRKENNIED